MAEVVASHDLTGKVKTQDAGYIGAHPGGIKRGDIHMARLPDHDNADGLDARPILIIQNNIGNELSPSIIAACITSNIGSHSNPVNIRIPDGLLPKRSAVRLSQIMTMDKRCIGEKIARMPDETMDKVDEALRVSLGLPKLE